MWVKCALCDGRGIEGDQPVNPPIIMRWTDNTQAPMDALLEVSIKECPTKLELAMKFKVFSSVNQAKKNGWGQPLKVGDRIKVKKSIVTITE